MEAPKAKAPPEHLRVTTYSRSPPPRPLKQYEAIRHQSRQKNLAALGLVSTDVLHFFVLVVLSTIGGIPCASLHPSPAESRRMPPPECRLFFVPSGGLHGPVQPRLPRQLSSTASSAELARREPTRAWTLALRAGERCFHRPIRHQCSSSLVLYRQPMPHESWGCCAPGAYWSGRRNRGRYLCPPVML